MSASSPQGLATPAEWLIGVLHVPPPVSWLILTLPSQQTAHMLGTLCYNMSTLSLVLTHYSDAR